jgi:NADH:ubiquinone oxidoreductase subunit 2 (subunit N)
MIYMYMREADEKTPVPEPLTRPVQAIICIGLFFILLLGIHPDQILNLADSSILILK